MQTEETHTQGFPPQKGKLIRPTFSNLFPCDVISVDVVVLQIPCSLAAALLGVVMVVVRGRGNVDGRAAVLKIYLFKKI